MTDQHLQLRVLWSLGRPRRFQNVPEFWCTRVEFSYLLTYPVTVQAGIQLPYKMNLIIQDHVSARIALMVLSFFSLGFLIRQQRCIRMLFCLEHPDWYVKRGQTT